MSWYYVGNGNSASTTFWVTDPTTNPIRGSVSLRRYSSLDLTKYDAITFSPYMDSTDGSPGAGICPRMFNLREAWMLLPGSIGGYFGSSNAQKSINFKNWRPWLSYDNGTAWHACSPLPVDTTKYNFTYMNVGGYLRPDGTSVWVVYGNCNAPDTTGNNTESFLKSWYSDDFGATWTAMPGYVDSKTGAKGYYYPMGFGSDGMRVRSKDLRDYYTSDLFATTPRFIANYLPPSKTPFTPDVNFTRTISYFTWDNFITNSTPDTWTKGYGDTPSGDIDRQAKTYHDSGRTVPGYFPDRTSSTDTYNCYQEVIFLGNNTWFRAFGLYAGSPTTGPLYIPKDSSHNILYGELSLDGGSTWTAETTTRFSGFVYTPTNAIRTWYGTNRQTNNVVEDFPEACFGISSASVS